VAGKYGWPESTLPSLSSEAERNCFQIVLNSEKLIGKSNIGADWVELGRDFN
jgi:hypothetical protein